MKLGINTYTYMWSIGFEGARPREPLSASGLLAKAHELGVHVVQMGPNLPLNTLSDAELDAFCQRARDSAIELELATRGLETDHVVSQIALSRRLHSTLLRTIPEIGGQMPTIEAIPGYLRRILPSLEANGVRLAIENGKIPAQDLRRVIEEIDSPLVGIVLDTTNSLALPEGWKYVAQTLAPYVMCLHLKEFIIKRAWHMMGFICEGRPTGQGQLDVPWLLDVVKTSRYDFNVIVELWPPEQRALQETIDLEQAWAKESIPYVRQYVKE
jgi:sugar phosphate isomerase/epimerase